MKTENLGVINNSATKESPYKKSTTTQKHVLENDTTPIEHKPINSRRISKGSKLYPVAFCLMTICPPIGLIILVVAVCDAIKHSKKIIIPNINIPTNASDDEQQKIKHTNIFINKIIPAIYKKKFSTITEEIIHYLAKANNQTQKEFKNDDNFKKFDSDLKKLITSKARDEEILDLIEQYIDIRLSALDTNHSIQFKNAIQQIQQIEELNLQSQNVEKNQLPAKILNKINETIENSLESNQVIDAPHYSKTLYGPASIDEIHNPFDNVFFW